MTDPTDALVTDVLARDCTSRAALEDVASTWGLLVLLALGEGDHRFNALRRRVSGVSERMLSRTLQTLERDGLVDRTVLSAIPPSVEYSLTDLGRRVAGRVRGLADLLEDAASDIGAAREAYDVRRPAR
ncbi:helix-turn-helix domain-containing protein [Rhodococcus aerolatus]